MPFQKGYIPWNKNKKMSQEFSEKMSERIKQEWAIGKRKPVFGRVCSEEKKKKISDAQKGKKSREWIGDKVKYRGLHTWIVNNWGKADICQICGSNKNVEWHNKNGRYDREIKDEWEKLCRKCHMIKDGRIKNGFVGVHK